MSAIGGGLERGEEMDLEELERSEVPTLLRQKCCASRGAFIIYTHFDV